MTGRFLFPAILFFAVFPAIALAGRQLPVSTDFPEGFATIDELNIQSLDGEEIPGTDLLGQAVAVVFLKPSCPRCTRRIPDLEKTWQTFKEEDFVLIAVSSAGDKESLVSLKNHYGVDWVWAKNNTEIKKQLDNHARFEILVFDRTGLPRFRIDENDRKWKVHLELCIGAAIERPLDLSAFPRGYVGSAVCGICHRQEWDQWAQTPHASSMSPLRKKQNHYKVQCVVCHVTGEAGKEVRPWRMTPRELQDVGCEECHGPGGPHRTEPYPGAEIHSTEESSCIRCHDQKNSPDWDYRTYLSRVVHKTPEPEEGGTSHGLESDESNESAQDEAPSPDAATGEIESSHSESK